MQPALPRRNMHNVYFVLRVRVLSQYVYSEFCQRGVEVRRSRLFDRFERLQMDVNAHAIGLGLVTLHSN